MHGLKWPINSARIVPAGGVLCAGAGAMRHEQMLLVHSGLMSRNVFMRTLFRRTFILSDDMRRVRKLIETHDSDPQAVVVVRKLLGAVSQDISNLGNIACYLRESLDTVRVRGHIIGHARNNM